MRWGKYCSRGKSNEARGKAFIDVHLRDGGSGDEETVDAARSRAARLEEEHDGEL